MEAKLVTATIRSTCLGEVEGALHGIGISGVTISRAHGYGEHHEVASSEPRRTYLRLEVLTAAERATEVARAIMQSATTGDCGDGLVAVLPVDAIWRIRSCSQPEPEELT